jgi:hypothetical protein
MSQLNLSIGYEEDKLGLTIRFTDMDYPYV